MIVTQSFGQTGHLSTRTIFGAAALSRATQEEADHTLEVLLDYGINHIDTAARYGDSELRLGPWMKAYRQRFFLATKTGQRTSREALDELRRSLERLCVEQVDLWQLRGCQPFPHRTIGRGDACRRSATGDGPAVRLRGCLTSLDNVGCRSGFSRDRACSSLCSRD